MYQTGDTNINKRIAHLHSSTHTRGVEHVYNQVVKTYRLQWICKELAYQRLFCTSVSCLRALMHSQQLLSLEAKCMWARLDVVHSLWEKNAKVAMGIRRNFYEKALGSKLCEAIIGIVISYIPECTKKYKELFSTGQKNFQMLNSHMGHQSTKRMMTSSVATDFPITRKKFVTKWTDTYGSTVRCV
tara:strand:+ start:915 stop:1472 length:558 start_codon:yes stop_codon:yes gene_type:complete